MCKPSKPKIQPAKPLAAPPPPPEESAGTAQGAPEAPADATTSQKRKRKGRSALRIDLNTGGTSASNGLNIPV